MAKPQFIFSIDTNSFLMPKENFVKEDYPSFVKDLGYFTSVKMRDNLDGIGQKGLDKLVSVPSNARFITAQSENTGGIFYQLLQGNQNFKQLLPYTVFKVKGEDRYFAYYRTSTAGESRLVGNSSIGFGGHMDLLDAEIKGDSSIDMNITIYNCVEREIEEELSYSPEFAAGFYNAYSKADFYLLNDDSNEVGKLHLGLVKVIEVAEEDIKSTNEDELAWIGAKTKEEILGLNPESWTEIILRNI